MLNANSECVSLVVDENTGERDIALDILLSFYYASIFQTFERLQDFSSCIYGFKYRNVNYLECPLSRTEKIILNQLLFF